MFLTIITFVIVLGIVVLIHEIGHFTSARLLGVKVEEFGIGFPPRVFGYKKNDTIYSINLIPVGGFVKIKGEDGSATTDKDSFGSQAIWKRFIIISAGVIMNVVLAMILLGIGFGIGIPSVLEDGKEYKSIRDEKVQVIEVGSNTPASEIGLEIGDQIYKIDGQLITSIDDLQSYNQDKVDQNISLVIKRYSEEIEHNVILRDLDETGTGKIGVGLVETAIVSYNWFESIWLGVRTAVEMLWAIIEGFYIIIKSFFVGQAIPGDIAGPVGIAVITGQIAKLGIIYLMQFTALLSLNLAIINFIPFPALDGGRALFLIIEKVRGKVINRRVEAMIHNIGFSLLMVAFVLLTLRDINKFRDNIIQFFKNIF